MGFHLPFVKPFYMSDDNFLAAGYQLFFYEVDSETTKPTYQDFDLTIPNTNPIILDAAGRFNCFLLAGPYKAVLKTPVAQGSATVWTQPKLSGLGSDSLSIVNTIEELKALAPAAANQVLVLGYYFPGDGGGGLFLWNGASTDVDNGGIFIQPDILPATGRWIRSFTGPTNLLWFGAKADGATTDSDAFQRAIAYAVVSALGNGEIEITTRGAAAEPPVEAAYYFGTVVAGLNGSGFRLTIHKNAQLNFNLAQEIGGSLNAGPYRWVSSLSAAVTFGAQCKLEQGAYPEWWGGLGDDTFDNIDALAALFASVPGRIVFSKGNYATSGGIGGIPAGTIIEAIGQVEDMLETPLIPIGLQVKGAGTLIKAQDLEAVASIIAGNNITAGDQIAAGNHIKAGQDVGEVGLLSQRMGTGTLSDSPAVSVANTQSVAASTSGTGVDVLMSKLIPADSLVVDGDALRFTAGGSIVQPGESTWNMFFQEAAFGTILTFVLDNESPGTPNPAAWRMVVEVMKRGANLIVNGSVFVDMLPENTGPVLLVNTYTLTKRALPAIVTTADKTFRIAGEDVSGAASITQDYMIVEYIKNK